MTIQLKLTPAQLHKQYSHDKTIDYITLIYQYMRLTNTWKFYGYRCTKCNQPIKTPQTLVKHKSSCKVINTVSKRKYVRK